MKNTDRDSEKYTPVLIVGGGVVGLSAALFLSQHGVEPLLVEKHERPSIQPRGRGFDIRTMELFRELKLSEQIREAGKSLGPSFGIIKGTSLSDALKDVKPGKRKSPEKILGFDKLAELSPESVARCTQDISEPLLIKEIKNKGLDIRFGNELVSVEQTATHIRATIKDRITGNELNIIADYLIAADGSKSPVRNKMNVVLQGPGEFADLLNIYFEADLKDFVKGREFSQLIIDEPDLKGFFPAINNNDRWIFHLRFYPEKGERKEDFTEEKLDRILQRVIGLPGIKIRIISTAAWRPTARVVEEMTYNRIFLAGDAAHTMTPYGGKGANTGIQDVHNLAWKLALVIKGIAAPKLLDTYTPERQPVGQFNTIQSGNWTDRNGLLNKKKAFNVFKILSNSMAFRIANFFGFKRLAQRIGMIKIAGMIGLPDYRYVSTAILNEEIESKGFKKAKTLSGDPGTRFPHSWVSCEKKIVSTLDLLGKHFVLFTTKENEHWRLMIEKMNKQFKIDARMHVFGQDLKFTDPNSSAKSLYNLSADAAVLVRPDGFVAWRTNTANEAAFNGFENALKQFLKVN